MMYLLLCLLLMSGGLLTTGLKEEANTSTCIEKERQALLDIKTNLTDVSEALSDWDSQQELDCCQWVGVSCNNHTGHVVRLDFTLSTIEMYDHGFECKISPSLQVLDQLRDLNLNNIVFQSNPVSNVLASMSNLQSLHISGANLKGPIPHLLANLSKLRYLDLSRNDLTGPIPHHLANLSKLRYLDLSNNSLTGRIPHHLVNLSKLRYLDLRGNSLTGPIPHHLANLSKLHYLDLSGNSLTGPFPFSFGGMTSLAFLDLSLNHIEGTIPKSFVNISSLAHLDLSSNLLNGSFPNFVECSSLIKIFLAHNSFSGSMPSFTGCMSLQILDLSNNFLSGHMPSSVGGLPNLEYIDVGHNSLNGSMPDFTGCTSLLKLVLSNNFLSGHMPNNMGELPNLVYLDVGHNSLTGSIPNFIYPKKEKDIFIHYPALSTLDLSSNNFSGNIPKSLGQLSYLSYLDFSSNSLVGVISEVHFLYLESLYYLDLSSNSDLSLDLNFNETTPFQLLTIKLRSCKLGPRFPMWIRTQVQLQHLDISSSGISEAPPAWFWDLPSGLEFLNISSNQIGGNLRDIHITPKKPPFRYRTFFHAFPGLDLSNNHFEGKVPLLPSQLAALNLSGNRFLGSLSFLCDIGTDLTFLDVSNNSFSGSLPDCWSNFQERLVILNLSNNSLSGEIPSSLGTLSNLEALYLRTNAFAGEVPMSLQNCTKLRFLDLSENKLSGFIPKWIGEKLLGLYVLGLASNRFYGELPSRLCWLYNLQVLDLSGNRLSSYIPRCFDNFTAMTNGSFNKYDMSTHSYYSFIYFGPRLKDFSPAQKTDFFDNTWVRWKGKERSFGRSGLQLLKSIDLSRNNLNGTIPYEITNLQELVSLNLSINKLHGEIPQDMGRLRSLESLDLSRNEFSGKIPWTLSNLNFLSYLDLSNNNLSGRIPTSTQLQSFNDTSYTGNPQLCGPPLKPRCGFQPVVRKKDVEDEEDLSKAYYTGMGAGFSVGFLGICSALFLNRGFRYLFFAFLTHMKDWIYVTVVVHLNKLERKLRGGHSAIVTN